MPTDSRTTWRSAPASWPALTPARAMERRLPGTWDAAINSTAPWPGTRNLMLTRSNRITRRCWRPSPTGRCGPRSTTINDRSGSSTWNRGPFDCRDARDEFTLENLQIARHRAVHWTLSRDLDQAHPLVFVQIALQGDLLNDPLGFLANLLAFDLFADDHALVVGADRHTSDRPAFAPGIEQDRQHGAVPEGRQQELIGIGSQTVATGIDWFVGDQRQVSGFDPGLVGRPGHVGYSY